MSQCVVKIKRDASLFDHSYMRSAGMIHRRWISSHSISRGTYSHTPVLVKECLRALNVSNRPVRSPKVYLDMTFGHGGHSHAILGTFSFSPCVFFGDVHVFSTLR